MLIDSFSVEHGMANAQIGIVGGGLAGALTALKLIRATTEGIDITLIGSDPEIGLSLIHI